MYYRILVNQNKICESIFNTACYSKFSDISNNVFNFVPEESFNCIFNNVRWHSFFTCRFAFIYHLKCLHFQLPQHATSVCGASCIYRFLAGASPRDKFTQIHKGYSILIYKLWKFWCLCHKLMLNNQSRSTGKFFRNKMFVTDLKIWDQNRCSFSLFKTSKTLNKWQNLTFENSIDKKFCISAKLLAPSHFCTRFTLCSHCKFAAWPEATRCEFPQTPPECATW